MPLSMFSPIIYLFLGLVLGKFPIELKGKISAWLTKIVIPFVIIYNIATHKSGTFAIMLGIIVMMTIMLWLSRLFTKDVVQSLCFFYLNIGWLGLPIASTLFGDGAAMVIIAAYVGSSLFGNSVGVGLMAHDQDIQTRIKQTLKAPPVWALLVGLACIPFRESIEILKPVYDVMKFLMGFMGMVVLGIWLSLTKLKIADFKQALLPFFLRCVTIFLLVSIFIMICQYYDIRLVLENKPTLYLLCLLPPAANIIVLETHYMKSGRSASMIACGTCLSIFAIAIYVAAVMWWF
jgi:predicted permease